MPARTCEDRLTCLGSKLSTVRLDAEEARTVSGFSLSVHAGDGVVTVTVAGDVDLAEADGLWEDLSPLLAPGTTMLVDFSEVAFLDSFGLRILLRLAESADAVGATFRLTAVSAPVLCC